MQIVMNGAGAAGIAVCQLLMNHGLKNFIVCDTKRDIYEGRPENMNPFKNKIAELTNRDKIKGTLADVLKGANAVIGLSGLNRISIDNVKRMTTKQTKEEIELIVKEAELEKLEREKQLIE